MKRRNLLLALVLLALFAAGGVLYFRGFVVQKPFGIILFTGEGLISSRLAAARLYEGGADRLLTVEKLPHLALLSAHGNDLAITDAAAAASALSTGKKVNQRALATDPTGQPLPTLLELARGQGRAVGLVTTGCLTDPTPAAFYAHGIDARAREPLAAALVERAGVNVLLGGGRADFLPEFKGGRRRDARDLLLDASTKGNYILARTGAELAGIPVWRNPRVLGLFADDALSFRDGGPAGTAANNADAGIVPTLAEMTRTAIEILQREGRGYLLVVDGGGLAARASAANQGERALRETLELDRAVDVALQYAGGGDKTLLVVAGTVATGGMVLNGYPLRQDRGIALLGTNVYGLPAVTWATGPNGRRRTTTEGDDGGGGRNDDTLADASPSLTASSDLPPIPSPVPSSSPSPSLSASSNEPAAAYAPAAANTADAVLGAGLGPGSERLQGFLDNTVVFELIRAQL